MNVAVGIGVLFLCTCVYSRSVISQESLLHAIQMTIDAIPTQNEQTNTSATVTTTIPPPGRMNVCDDLCPKWCEKVAGSETNVTHCHYVCGNICSEHTTANPYIGVSLYEVVPSTFDFNRFDTNEDKHISKDEFAATEGIPLEETNKIFTFTDLNGDGFIDTDEFRAGPFVFTVQMAAELSSMVQNASKKPNNTN